MKSLILNSASTAYSVLTGCLFRRPERTGDDGLFSGPAARRADRAVHRAWPAVRAGRADGSRRLDAGVHDGPADAARCCAGHQGSGDRPFLIVRDERRSYAEQARIIAGLARCLAGEHGLRKGDRVARWLTPRPQLRLASTRAGWGAGSPRTSRA